MRLRLLSLATASLLCQPLFASEAVGRAGLQSVGSRSRELRLSGVLDAERSEELVLSLARHEGSVPGATLIVHGAEGDRTLSLPRTSYWSGSVEGRPGARVTLAVRENGEVRGLLFDDQGAASLRASPLEADLVFHRVARDASETPFRCGADDLLAADPLATLWEPPLGNLPTPGAPASVTHTARVAVETDYEYFQLFGDATAAAEYALDLLAFSSTIYAGEVGADLAVGSVSIWTTAADPWLQSSTACGLFEFGRYWNDNHQGVERTIAHFLSGKPNGGGIAWVGVLCSGAFSYDIGGSGCGGMPDVASYGGGYGYTGTIDGNFEPGNPQPIWDTIAVTHEIGHNFGSPHTHCYANYGGSASHVDQCWTSTSAGCYNGTLKTLPGLGSVTGGTPGAGNGTIMSYCHLLSPYDSNISLTFGLDHPYGVLADRVPQRMAAHVASRAAADPACLAPVVSDLVFEDDFESGGTAHWSAQVL